MKNIVVFTGAGISAESGIPTFRGMANSLWSTYNVDEVATVNGWNNDKKKVLDFHNLAKAEMEKCKPNPAHTAMAELEGSYNVTIVTQNIDTLHEKAGSSNVLHIHGRIDQSRSCANPNLIYNINPGEGVHIGDRCELGSQKRFNTVLFGDQLPAKDVLQSLRAIRKADILIVIGCSMQVEPAASFILEFSGEKMYIINPEKPDCCSFMNKEKQIIDAEYIQDVASKGVLKIMKDLT